MNSRHLGRCLFVGSLTLIAAAPGRADDRGGRYEDFSDQADVGDEDEDENEAPRWAAARSGETVIEGFDEEGMAAAWVLRARRLVRVAASADEETLPPEGEDENQVARYALRELGRRTEVVVSDRFDDGHQGREVRIEVRGRAVARLTDPERRFGDTVSVAGDLDGDGLTDLLVTAPTACDCCDCSGMTDKVHVYLGAETGPRFRRATTLEGPEGVMGWIAAIGVGDVNRDGFDDLLVAHGEALSLHLGQRGGVAQAGTVVHRRTTESGELSLSRLPDGRPGAFWVDMEDQTAGIAERRGRRLRVRSTRLPQ